MLALFQWRLGVQLLFLQVDLFLSALPSHYHEMSGKQKWVSKRATWSRGFPSIGLDLYAMYIHSLNILPCKGLRTTHNYRIHWILSWEELYVYWRITGTDKKQSDNIITISSDSTKASLVIWYLECKNFLFDEVPTSLPHCIALR